MALDRLTDKQALFLALISEGKNATDAYLTAYSGNCSRKSAAVNGAKLLKHPLIAAARARQQAMALAAVDAAVDRYQITADRVADEMARLAFTRIDQVAAWHTVGDGQKARQIMALRDMAAIDQDALSAISEIKRDSGGALSVKLYNKREALMDIARLKGWIADKPVDQRNLVVLKVER